MDVSRKAVALVVDDDNFFRKSLQLSLTTAGFRCLLAADGEEALELYSKTKPDLVVLDRIMPRAGGTRFLMGVRDNPNRRASVLVVYSSTLKEATDTQNDPDAAIPGFSRILEVPKTVSPSDLALRVKEMFFPAA